MRFSTASIAAFVLSSTSFVAAQTYTDCDPLQKTCPADPALGTSKTFDFTQGPSSDFTATGTPTYDSNGVGFTVAKQGDAPLIQSKWYIMFGRVEFQIKAAPGTGIVSSAVLQSDDLDEIDWEWLGGDDTQVQTNYFGKGDTTTYNRGAFHSDPGNHDGFHTYTVDWTSEQIVWQIDGNTVRVLTPSTAAANQYPESPMMVKVGVWAGGDPSNAAGTIAWAGGTTDYGAGPYTMYMKSLSVTDYSTGTSYTYGDKSGSWESIISDGGKINGNIGAAPKEASSAPPVTSTAESGPLPWSGTHKETSSFSTPSIYPWVPGPTTMSTETASSYPGLPSGWTINSSGHAIPPSAAPSTSPPSSLPSPSSSASPSPSGHTTRPATLATTSTRRHSTLVTSTSLAAHLSASSTSSAPVAPSTGGANSNLRMTAGLGAFCAFLGGALALF
ncbi:CAZyme family GH16 [Paecilomyces variotii]|nr:CAZyme family GH16 [Paecilomyces variotii]